MSRQPFVSLVHELNGIQKHSIVSMSSKKILTRSSSKQVEYCQEIADRISGQKSFDKISLKAGVEILIHNPWIAKTISGENFDKRVYSLISPDTTLTVYATCLKIKEKCFLLSFWWPQKEESCFLWQFWRQEDDKEGEGEGKLSLRSRWHFV